MSVDFMTIAVCCIMLLMAFVTPLCNGFFRKPHTGKGDNTCTNDESNGESPKQTTAPHPAISVVITAHDRGGELERNLPLLLSQDYEGKFEVIVVDESSTDRTDDVLTRLKSQHANLYTTFIPQSSHYLSRRKLALTVGIKAAKSEWVLLTDADCRPDSSKWLTEMSRCCTDSYDIVMGYTNYTHDTKAFYRFERLLTMCYTMRHAIKSVAYRYNGNNIAIRKSMFMNGNGFLRNLKYLRGEYDFIVNEYAAKGRTAVVTHPHSFVRQEAPSHKTWSNTHLFYMETRRHLARSTAWRAIFATDTTLLHINYLADAAILACSVTLRHNIATAATAAAAIIITAVMRTVIATRAIRTFGERIAIAAIPFMELRVMWQNAWFMLRHKTSDKYDFIRR